MTNLRNRLDLYMPAEMAMHNAIQEIETMGADVRLTNAQILIQQAKDLVAEFIIEKNIGNNDTRPLNVSGAYIVIAYRYGHREGHSYLVDICGGIDTAKEAAEKEANERGGKYSVVVFAKRIATGDVEEIYEAKCPEHYTANTSPLISKKTAIDFGAFIYSENCGVDIKEVDKSVIEKDYDMFIKTGSHCI